MEKGTMADEDMRRVKILTLDPAEVLSALRPKKDINMITNLPKGYKIQAINTQLASGCVQIMINHPDFPVTALGCEPEPFVKEYEMVKIEKELLTMELVEELATREGVDREDVPPEAEGGPSILLRITD